MKTHIRLLAVSAALAAWAIALSIVSPSYSADDKDLKSAVNKIAAELAKGNDAGAKKEAAGLKDADLDAVMSLFKLRMRKGIGIGPKANAITPDGIEAKLIGLGNKAPSAKDLGNQSDALAEAGYRAAAIALAVHGKSPVDKKQGQKDPAKWKEWSEEMQKAALDFASAAKSKKPKDVKDAATKLNASCNHCHEVFRD